ncbi:MAG: hypothetical protein ACRDD7_00340 [Peptostreptococcaceae bacterium]
MKVLVVKNQDNIIICSNGSKMILKSNTDLYELLINRSIEEIIQWYKLKGGE